MAKKVIVGGRIESKEVGGIVTGAAEILDDTKGKKQSVINQETDTELLRLDQSKQNNLTFDNSPTEGSNNPVKSAGVYAADKELSDAIEAILLLIPGAASALNKLVDMATMNSSISTATATFKGTYNVVTDLQLAIDATHEQIAVALGNVISTADNNDYAFVQVPVSAESTDIRRTERYKFNGTAWGYEYDLNTSGFTAAQWAAINSGITLALVGKLIGLPTSSELQALLGQKQDTLTFDNVPTAGSNNPVKSGGINTAISNEAEARQQLAQSVSGIDGRVGNIEAVIPAGAAANNKLVANSSMEAYVASIIDAITASFTIATADGHINLTLTQTNGRVASLTLTSSDIASAQALTALTGRVSTAEGNITTLGGRVSTNETDIANLQQLYNNLQQSKPIPVTALPETGQQQGVIYRLAGTTSYSDYMWNGSTWVLMATYNNAIDPRPKKASQNLVTSGGVFDNMGALDVSELNATENPHTLAKYVDLSAALAAIPTDYQKGGMSIKFVQSSDNKYVQCRFLLSGSFTDAQFANTANWQNQGAEIELLNQTVGIVDFQSSTANTALKLPLTKGKYKATLTKSNTAVTNIVLSKTSTWDESTNLTVLSSNKSVEKIIYVDGDYGYVWISGQAATLAITTYFQDRLLDDENNIEKAISKFGNLDSYSVNDLIKLDGTLNNDIKQTNRTSDFIYIRAGETISFRSVTDSSHLAIAFYTSKNYSSFVDGVAGCNIDRSNVYSYTAIDDGYVLLSSCEYYRGEAFKDAVYQILVSELSLRNKKIVSANTKNTAIYVGLKSDTIYKLIVSGRASTSTIVLSKTDTWDDSTNKTISVKTSGNETTIFSLNEDYSCLWISGNDATISIYEIGLKNTIKSLNYKANNFYPKKSETESPFDTPVFIKRLLTASSLPQNDYRSVYCGLGYDVVWDEDNDRYVMVIAGYNGTLAQVGLMYSDDLINWTDYGVVLSPTGIEGDPDKGSITFPQLLRYNNKWIMYYVGYDETGFEQGKHSICYAESTDFINWTRGGKILDVNDFVNANLGFNANTGVIYRPRVINVMGKYFMFINGGPTGDAESGGPNENIYLAESEHPTKDWEVMDIVLDANDIFPNVPYKICSDPDVITNGKDFIMCFWGNGGTYFMASNFNEFPNNWRKIDNITISGYRPLMIPCKECIYFVVNVYGEADKVNLYRANWKFC